ncbi:MAG: hypothetical protein Q9174_005609, partial [Haloplaca sp. 1 TL-2023]
MADPLSGIAGVVGIATAAIRSSKALFDLVNDTKRAPTEIKAIARDVYAFASIVLSVSATLKRDIVRGSYGDDESVAEAIGNIRLPLSNCHTVLEDLIAGLQKGSKLSSVANKSQRAFINLKWAVFTKNEIKELRDRLEAAKSTLDVALSVISFSNMRFLAISMSAVGQPMGVLTGGRPLEVYEGINSATGAHLHDGSTIPAHASTSLGQNCMALVASSPTRDNVLSNEDDYLLDDDSGFSIYHDPSPTPRSNDRVTVDEWFSINESLPIINQVSVKVSGSPDYEFERLSSFYPEQYTVEGLFHHRIFAVAMLPCRINSQIHNYYLLYAETPRRWHRVIFSVAFRANPRVHTFLRAISSEHCDWNGKTLPEDFQKKFSPVLASLQSFGLITRIKLYLSDIYSPTETYNVQAAEDLNEVALCDQRELLHYVEDRGIQPYKESEVLVISRMGSTLFQVKVASFMCTERKVPFATAARGYRNGFREYVEDLKLLIALQGSSGVSKFRGVVLNDTKTQLRSYVYEHPALGNIFGMLLSAGIKGETIPLFIRLAWSSQMLQAVAYVHERGYAVGANFNLVTWGVREDGTILLTEFSSYPEYVLDNCEVATRKTPTAGLRAEVVFLAKRLWMLGSHIHNATLAANFLCRKAGCTAKPRYTCRADHRDPLELPPCLDNTPPYFDDIIRSSRSPDPMERPSASALANIMSDNCHARIHPVHVETILRRYAAPTKLNVRCDE